MPLCERCSEKEGVTHTKKGAWVCHECAVAIKNNEWEWDELKGGKR
jgi:transcription initiation factor TFIIIB Brf1 subunit/transcription initiation factor TFIIB